MQLTDTTLSLTQSDEDRLLRIVHVGYGYTLTRDADCDLPEEGLEVSIDILGDDLISDDLLARDIDRHVVACRAGATTSQQRRLVVAQALLDEDIGDDEIKLRISAHDASGTRLATAMTPIVRGAF
ncbi:MAG: hypothetical protein AAF515_19435 [Pseudomonadota bacterium]